MYMYTESVSTTLPLYTQQHALNQFRILSPNPIWSMLGTELKISFVSLFSYSNPFEDDIPISTSSPGSECFCLLSVVVCHFGALYKSRLPMKKWASGALHEMRHPRSVALLSGDCRNYMCKWIFGDILMVCQVWKGNEAKWQKSGFLECCI